MLWSLKMKFMILLEIILRDKKNWAEWRARKRVDLEASSSSRHQCHSQPNHTSFISWAKPPGGSSKSILMDPNLLHQQQEDLSFEVGMEDSFMSGISILEQPQF